ncbi:MAG: hypothetical protein SGJ21_04960 [Alphaproteobacteria bacterium]|nr:hypothetical protein [Alphaproteobacteria bacterium]
MNDRPEPPRPSRIDSLNRGVRRALLLQMLLLLAAIAAIVWAGLKLADVRQREDALQLANSELGSAQEQLTAKSAEVASKEAQLLEKEGELLKDAEVASISYQAFEALARKEPTAIKLFREAIDLRSDDPELHRNLARAIADTEKSFTGAAMGLRAFVERAEPGRVTPADYASVAYYMCSAGDYASALQFLQDAPAQVRDAFRLDPKLVAENATLKSACKGQGQTLAALSQGVAATQPFAIKKVFLHIAAESQRADAQTLKVELEKGAYRVVGIELVDSSDHSIRYYYNIQGETGEVDRLQQALIKAAADGGLAGWAEPYRAQSLDGRYERLPPDRAEVWL